MEVKRLRKKIHRRTGYQRHLLVLCGRRSWVKCSDSWRDVGATPYVCCRHLFGGWLHIQEAANDLARLAVVHLAHADARVCYGTIWFFAAALMAGYREDKKERGCRWRSILSNPGDDGLVLHDSLHRGALPPGVANPNRLA